MTCILCKSCGRRVGVSCTKLAGSEMEGFRQCFVLDKNSDGLCCVDAGMVEGAH